MKPLVIFELANNHMGSISHAKLIIKKYYEISKKFRDKIDFAVKFQYRDPETFIHESFKESDDNQVVRFQSTFFSRKDWSKIIKFSRSKFKIICTPFDEISVNNVVKDKFDYLKIASCSATDWPLIEFIAKRAKHKKIICSLGGLDNNEISSVISFFSSRNIDVNFLYCVAKYPTNSDDLNLAYFHELKKLYGKKISGISLHEDPNKYLSGSIGYSMGARIFEKHVGISKGKIKLNKYSVSQNQMYNWLSCLYQTIKQIGTVKGREKNLPIEKKQLKNFQRGAYFKKNIKSMLGKKLKKSEISFQFPAISGQLTANDFSKFTEIFLKKDGIINNKIIIKYLKIKDLRIKISQIRDKVRNLAYMANIVVPNGLKIEISHHYGLRNFYKFGLSMITVINQSYCKKYLFLFKNQKHPPQYHKIKQETFLVLYGKLLLKTKFKEKVSNKIMSPGEVITISKGMVHEFKGLSSEGVVIEEISSKSIKTDSYYLDKEIIKNHDRKSLIAFY